jgi:hypothetical protein
MTILNSSMLSRTGFPEEGIVVGSDNVGGRRLVCTPY